MRAAATIVTRAYCTYSSVGCLRSATCLLTTGGLDPLVGTYCWVGGFSELIDAINCAHQRTSKPVEVSMDTETMGLHP